MNQWSFKIMENFRATVPVVYTVYVTWILSYYTVHTCPTHPCLPSLQKLSWPMPNHSTYQRKMVFFQLEKPLKNNKIKTLGMIWFAAWCYARLYRFEFTELGLGKGDGVWFLVQVGTIRVFNFFFFYIYLFLCWKIIWVKGTAWGIVTITPGREVSSKSPQQLARTWIFHALI